jgi:branched-chain amino acid transport system ATP-binding protein
MSARLSSCPSPNGSRPTERVFTPVLEIEHVTAGYGGTIVLRDVTISVPKGAVVALLGPNGAGKTTLLRVAAGVISPSAGDVSLSGKRVTPLRPFQRTRRGLCLVPEGRGIFPGLTVRENLLLQIPPWERSAGIDAALEAFPVLKQRLRQVAGSMSGGEQQILAVSRCFLAEPSVVLLDEVSMGLAPRVIDEIFAAILTLKRRGTSLLIVEQYVGRALAVADHIYLINKGHIELSGSPQQIDQSQLLRQYIGEGPPQESAQT